MRIEVLLQPTFFLSSFSQVGVEEDRCEIPACIHETDKIFSNLEINEFLMIQLGSWVLSSNVLLYVSNPLENT